MMNGQTQQLLICRLRPQVDIRIALAEPIVIDRHRRIIRSQTAEERAEEEVDLGLLEDMRAAVRDLERVAGVVERVVVAVREMAELRNADGEGVLARVGGGPIDRERRRGPAVEVERLIGRLGSLFAIMSGEHDLAHRDKYIQLLHPFENYLLPRLEFLRLGCWTAIDGSRRYSEHSR